jgi:ribose-phosphate pyrophosphokinase
MLFLANHNVKQFVTQSCLQYELKRFTDNGLCVKNWPIIPRVKNILLIHRLLNDSDLVEMLFTISLLKNCEISILIPYTCFARNEKSLEFLKSLLNRYKIIKNIFSIDMHTQINGIININMTDFWKNKIQKDFFVVAPDSGAILRNSKMFFDLYLNKYRKKSGEIEIAQLSATQDSDLIYQKENLIVDDIMDTGQTIISVSNFLKAKGAESINVCVTHLVSLTEEIIERIQNVVNIKKIYTTDTIQHFDLPNKYCVFSVFDYVLNKIKAYQLSIDCE